MSEPWFRQRWWGYQAIHAKGRRLNALYWIISIPVVAAGLSFAAHNNYITVAAFVALFFGNLAYGAVVISRTEKR